MSIQRDKNGFLIWPKDNFHQSAIGIESEKITDCIAEILRQKIKGVFGTVPYFQESNLDFLSKISHIEEAQFYDITLKNVSGLYGLLSLQYLRISGKRPGLDLEKLRDLRKLVIEHHKTDTGFEELSKLRMMHSWRLKPSHKREYEMMLPTSLEELGIFWWNVETLAPLNALPKLRILEIARCRNLSELGDLAKRFPSLERLTISASGRLTSEEAERAIQGHPKLSYVFAGNKLLLGIPPTLDSKRL